MGNDVFIVTAHMVTHDYVVPTAPSLRVTSGIVTACSSANFSRSDIRLGGCYPDRERTHALITSAEGSSVGGCGSPTTRSSSSDASANAR